MSESGQKNHTNLQTVVRKPKDPINGSSIGMLAAFLERQSAGQWVKPSVLTNVDLAFALNVPAQQMSGLRSAKSSAHVMDRRVHRDVPAEKSARKKGESLKCIRPYHAILIRLFLKYPQYGALIPPRPTDYEVYEAIQPFMRMPGEELNPPLKDVRRWFAQLFGRSLVTSHKMLPKEDTYATLRRENSRPVTQLQLLIMLRFAEEFRKLYGEYRAKFLPASERSNPLYIPESRSWDILRERDSLTDWMSDDLLADFDSDLDDRWRQWWDNKYMDTLRREALSRGYALKDVLTTEPWTNTDDVTDFRAFQEPPITGADGSLLTEFRELTGLSSSEFFWVLGISPKTYFMFRKRPNQRIEVASSILIRHFFRHPADLALFVEPPGQGEDILKTIQAIDPNFERKHLGVFFGGGSIAGYNMSRPNAMIPAFARRGASLLTRHLTFSNDIYWHMRECVEDEAKARGLSLKTLWDDGTWHEPGGDDLGDMNETG